MPSRHTHFAWDAQLGGTRYVQAPLCSPEERWRRLATVAFGAAAAGGGMQQAQADPVGAAWLPLLVYQGMAATTAMGGQQQDGQKEGQDATEVDAQQQQQQQQQRRSLEALVREQGWRPTQYGVTPPPLHAHWSDYYSSAARRPDVVAMAPWVAAVYERRQRRTAARGAVGSSGSSESE